MSSSSHADFADEVLAQLRSSNSDTSKPHTFDFYLYLPTEQVANTAAERIRKAGYTATVRAAAKGPGWLCLASHEFTPDKAPWAEVQALFSTLAKELKGDFDGWESNIIKKPTPK
jgi:rhodanese-related sulfurtransferase